MGNTRRKYTKEFKEQAVEFWLTSGKTSPQVAGELGISDGMLRHWATSMGKHGENSFPGQGQRLKGSDLEEEVRRLQKELRNVQEEREILKKALAILSRNPRSPIG